MTAGTGGERLRHPQGAQGPAAPLSAAAGRPRASLELGERIHAVKAVSFNEQFFQGHFPGRPIMPGVLQIEALAQAAGDPRRSRRSNSPASASWSIFMAIEDAKFRAPVEPGCLLDLEVGFVQKRSRVCKFKGKASVEGKMTCEVEFTAMIADPPKPTERRLQFRRSPR